MKRDQKKIFDFYAVLCPQRKDLLLGCGSGYKIPFLWTQYMNFTLLLQNYLHFCLDEPVYNSSQYRRKSVFAEAYNPEEDDGDDTKVRVNTRGTRDKRG